MVQLQTATSSLIANPAGAPRALKWITGHVAAMMGDAGVTLLNINGGSLQIDAVSDGSGALSPVAFDAGGVSYAGSATALRQVYRRQWGSSPTAASRVTTAPQAVSDLIGRFIAQRSLE